MNIINEAAMAIMISLAAEYSTDNKVSINKDELQLFDSEGEDTVSLDDMRDMELRDNGYKGEDWN